MHDHDREVIEAALRSACERCGLGGALRASEEIAAVCRSAEDAVDHPAWDRAASRIGGANQAGDCLPRIFHRTADAHRLFVRAAARRRAHLALVALDRLVHGLRLGPARGGVVEVDA